MASDSDKIKMSRLLKLARKFNCFYLTGKIIAFRVRRKIYRKRIASFAVA